MRRFPIRLAALAAAATIGLQSATAQDVFNNGAANTISGLSPDILVEDSAGSAPTIVDIDASAQVGFVDNAGVIEPIAAPSVTVTGASTVNLNGGQLADSFVGLGSSVSSLNGTIGNDIDLSENAQAIMSGGTADDLLLSGTSTFTMTGGELDTVELSGSSTFIFTGGLVDDIDEATDNSSVSVDGARVDDDAFFTGSARLDVFSGRFDDELQFFDNSRGFFAGGEVRDDLVVADNAQVTIQNFSVSDALEASGMSTTTVENGSFGAVEAVDGATVSIAAGVIEEGISSATGSQVTVGDMADPAGGFEVAANNSGEVIFTEPVDYSDLALTAQTGGLIELAGGTATNLVVNTPGGEVVLDFFGAETLDVNASLGGQITIDRGLFDDANLQALSNSEIEIVGKDFLVNGVPFPDGGIIPFSAGFLSATLSDGNPFSAIFSRQFSPIASVATIRLTLIPEPGACVLMLTAAAALASRRRKWLISAKSELPPRGSTPGGVEPRFRFTIRRHSQ